MNDAATRRTFLKWLGVTAAAAAACSSETAGRAADGAGDAAGLADGGPADVAASGDAALLDAAGDGAVGVADATGALDATGAIDTTGATDASGAVDAALDAAHPADSGVDAIGRADAGPPSDAAGSVDADASAADSGDGAGGDAGGSDAAPDIAEDTGAPKFCEPTGGDAKGPYYIAGAPKTMVLAGPDEPGQRLFVTGRVTDDACKPLGGALLDVWQADMNGDYHDGTKPYRLRGQLLADASGAFALETIIPGHYPQNQSFRPRHIHFTVSAPGHQPITTQMYFQGDQYLQPNDPCSSCNSGDPTHIVPLDSHPDGTFSSEFEIALAKL